jgi:hypothetical protein
MPKIELITIVRRTATIAFVAAMAGCGGREAVPDAVREPAAETGTYAGAPEVVGDSMLRFPGGAVYRPRVYGLQYLATLRDAVGEPVLLLSGAECHECDAPKTLYLRAPGRPLPPPEADTIGVFGYPGRVFDYMDEDKLDLFTTVFHGECLDRRGLVVLQFATVFDSAGARAAAYVTELAAGGLRDFEAVPRPDSAAVLARVAAGRCRELPGEDQLTPP